MTAVLGTRITFEEAVTEAVRMEMHRDPSVVLYSASGGGRLAAQLRDQFDDERTVETSVAGAPIVLAAAGAAAEGLRPVCELGVADTGAATLDQIAEVGALHSSNGTAPAALCIRLPCGDPLAGGGAAGANPLGWLIGTPGMKVVCPATPADAKGLTVSAIRDPDPVCVLEHAAVSASADIVPEGAHVVEIGRARLAREGTSLTVIAHGGAVPAVEMVIVEHGLDADLIDLRSVQPLDTAAVLTSVRKTGRVVLVEPDAGSHRVTAELVSAIWEQAFEYLDAPPRRVRLRSGLGPVNGGSSNGGAAADGNRAIQEACDECLAY